MDILDLQHWRGASAKYSDARERHDDVTRDKDTAEKPPNSTTTMHWVRGGRRYVAWSWNNSAQQCGGDAVRVAAAGHVWLW
jgi:hypothetical protein